MSEVNCGVDEKNNKLIYDRAAPAVQSCKKGDFSFEIKDASGGEEHAVFQVKKDGAVIRENISKPFAAGSIKKKSMDVNDMTCVVKVSKASGINLGAYFKKE